MANEEIIEITNAAAATSKRLASGTRLIQSHELTDLIALEQHRAQQEVSSQRSGIAGIRFARIVPGGCG